MSYNFQSMEKSPVIVVVGHIDHGKSTLLDYIRKTKITESEAGGITQRISAYEIEHQQKKMTLIDTPGHEAFSAMREQGALAADLAILVVSAEEGVKPQTLEAKATIEKNQLPYIVAINKIDKPTANLETTKKSLAENGIYLEGRGGEVPVAAISAKTGQGVPELLDLILLATEMAALKKDRPAETAGADWLAEGFILEVQTSPQQGVTAVAIIRRGALRRGDYLGAANDDCFRIKKLEDWRGAEAEVLTASSPAMIFGWKTPPAPGARWYSAATKDWLAEKIKPADGLPPPPARPAPAADQPASDGEKEKIVPVIIKTQTFGSRLAVEKEIGKISVPNLKIQILDSGIGALTENDIKLARASGAIVVGFQVKIEKAAADLAIKNQTTYGVFDIIYKLNEWLEAELGRRRPRIEVEIIIGSAKIIKLFSQTKNKQVVGGLVLEGKISNRRAVRVKRRGADLGAGEILELQQQQTAVKEVDKGKQFGALVETRHALAAGDVLEILEIERK